MIDAGGEDSPTADGLVAAFVGVRVLVGSHRGVMFTRVGGAITGWLGPILAVRAGWLATSCVGSVLVSGQALLGC